jgi:hypothetical protein
MYYIQRQSSSCKWLLHFPWYFLVVVHTAKSKFHSPRHVETSWAYVQFSNTLSVLGTFFILWEIIQMSGQAIACILKSYNFLFLFTGIWGRFVKSSMYILS